MTIDPKRGLITVWTVQHAGFPGDGNKSVAAFRKTAERFAVRGPERTTSFLLIRSGEPARPTQALTSTAESIKS